MEISAQPVQYTGEYEFYVQGLIADSIIWQESIADPNLIVNKS